MSYYINRGIRKDDMDDLIEYLQNMLEDFDFKRLIFPTIMILLYVAGFVYLLTIIKHDNKTISKNNAISTIETTNIKEEYIYVDVKGSIKNPGVYKLKSDARVIDAIEEAGGMLKDANDRYINLSKALNDGDVIIVYSNKEIDEAQKDNTVYIETPCVCEEVKNDACYKDTDNQPSNFKININTASVDELKTLSGIGEVKAKAIVEYRKVKGKFKTIEDIKEVNGISESLFEKIKDNITV